MITWEIGDRVKLRIAQGWISQHQVFVVTSKDIDSVRLMAVDDISLTFNESYETMERDYMLIGSSVIVGRSVCECGMEKVYGPSTKAQHHSSWCPLYHK